MDPRSRALRCRQAFCLFVSFSPRLLFSPLSPVFFHQQRRSQELHLAASRNRRGCGHRPQENSRYARTRPAHGKVIRASRRREKWSRKGSIFFPAAEQQPPPHGSPPSSHGRIIYTRPLPHPRTPTVNSSPGHFATQFLKVPSRRREPVFAGDSRSHI